MGILDRLADLMGFGIIDEREEPFAASSPSLRDIPEGGWAAAMTAVAREREEAVRRAQKDANNAYAKNTSSLLEDGQFIDWASREVLAQCYDYVHENRFGMTVDTRAIHEEARARLERLRSENRHGYDQLRIYEAIARRCNEELRGSPFYIMTEERGEYCERVLVFCRNPSIAL